MVSGRSISLLFLSIQKLLECYCKTPQIQIYQGTTREPPWWSLLLWATSRLPKFWLRTKRALPKGTPLERLLWFLLFKTEITNLLNFYYWGDQISTKQIVRGILLFITPLLMVTGRSLSSLISARPILIRWITGASGLQLLLFSEGIARWFRDLFRDTLPVLGSKINREEGWFIIWFKMKVKIV